MGAELLAGFEKKLTLTSHISSVFCKKKLTLKSHIVCAFRLKPGMSAEEIDSVLYKEAIRDFSAGSGRADPKDKILDRGDVRNKGEDSSTKGEDSSSTKGEDRYHGGNKYQQRPKAKGAGEGGSTGSPEAEGGIYGSMKWIQKRSSTFFC